MRPPSEVAAWRLWNLLDADLLTAATLMDVSKLLGGPATIRTIRMGTGEFPSGERAEFLAPEAVPDRLERLLIEVGAQNPPTHPILHAIGIYLESIFIHPLPDGNGRLSRLLFLGSLHRTLGLKVPAYPLAPAMAVNRTGLLTAFFAWEYDRNAEPIIHFIMSVLAKTNVLLRNGFLSGHIGNR